MSIFLKERDLGLGQPVYAWSSPHFALVCYWVVVLILVSLAVWWICQHRIMTSPEVYWVPNIMYLSWTHCTLHQLIITPWSLLSLSFNCDSPTSKNDWRLYITIRLIFESLFLFPSWYGGWLTLQHLHSQRQPNKATFMGGPLYESCMGKSARMQSRCHWPSP